MLFHCLEKKHDPKLTRVLDSTQSTNTDLITNVSMCDMYIKSKINQKIQQQQQLAALASIQKLEG